MYSLLHLAKLIWVEFVRTRSTSESLLDSQTRFPNLIPCNEGRSLLVSSSTLKYVEAFTRVLHDGRAGLKIVYGNKELGTLVKRAVGCALENIELSTDNDLAARNLLSDVERQLSQEFEKEQPSREYVFGCWLIRSADATEIALGPVRFMEKRVWLEASHAAKRVSSRVCARVTDIWDCRASSTPVDPTDEWRSQSIIDAIGDCPVVCSVYTNGLSADLGFEKAILAARLGMAALSLLWERPSTPMEGFGLLVEGEPSRRRYVVLGLEGAMTSSDSQTRYVGRTWVADDEWPTLWQSCNWLRTPVEALFTSLLDPSRPSFRPDVSRSLLHALWWLYEACRAEAPLIATVKFAACLDVLAGGMSESRILLLLEARLGCRADDVITPDGRTAKTVVKMIYGAGRSRTLHGSNDKYDQDWRATRNLAEHLTRICFVEALGWLEENPGAPSFVGALSAGGASS